MTVPEELRKILLHELLLNIEINSKGDIRYANSAFYRFIGKKSSDPLLQTSCNFYDCITETSIPRVQRAIHMLFNKSFKVTHFQTSLLCSTNMVPDMFLNSKDYETSPDQGKIGMKLYFRGILVDSLDGKETRILWSAKCLYPERYYISQMDFVLFNTLGIGSFVLQNHIERAHKVKYVHAPPPVPRLCYLCEKKIPEWYFEVHTDSCLVWSELVQVILDIQKQIHIKKAELLKFSQSIPHTTVSVSDETYLTLPIISVLKNGSTKYRRFRLKSWHSCVTFLYRQLDAAEQTFEELGKSTYLTVSQELATDMKYNILKKSMLLWEYIFLSPCKIQSLFHEVHSLLTLSLKYNIKLCNHNLMYGVTFQEVKHFLLRYMRNFLCSNLNSIDYELFSGHAQLISMISDRTHSKELDSTKVDLILPKIRIVPNRLPHFKSDKSLSIPLKYTSRENAASCSSFSEDDNLKEYMLRNLNKKLASKPRKNSFDDERAHSLRIYQELVEKLYSPLIDNTTAALHLPKYKERKFGDKTPRSLKEFTFVKEINRGASSRVYLVKKNSTGNYYAMKAIPKSGLNDLEKLRGIMYEKANMEIQKFGSNIVKVYYAFESEGFFCLVMDFFNGGDCQTLVEKFGPLPEQWIQKYIAELLEAVEILHKLGIFHRDVKPANMLIDQNGHIRLADLGLSDNKEGSSEGEISYEEQINKLKESSHEGARKQLVEGLKDQAKKEITLTSRETNKETFDPFERLIDVDTSNLNRAMSKVFRARLKVSLPGKLNDEKRITGTPNYMAPEVLSEKENPMSDIWAIGCVLFEMLTGIIPFQSDTIQGVWDRIQRNDIGWTNCSHELHSPEAIDLVNKLSEPNPEKRLGKGGFLEIKCHPFFRDIDWDHLYTQKGPFVPRTKNIEDLIYFERSKSTSTYIKDRMTGIHNSQTSHNIDDMLGNHIDQDHLVNDTCIGLENSDRKPHDDLVELAIESFSGMNLKALNFSNKNVLWEISDQLEFPGASSFSHPPIPKKGHSMRYRFFCPEKK
ncbi:AGC protein kinase Ppk31 [Schizosaccharomyces cryophilus OY26]|uniref:non-specific serine/threonine protein kinase n=1 Tax=Schizosaccharomyces cryophilus (strain OY26 / ATCC MYA-4695 / CBS 11777 / NBRC 106824 / NRRL Y48691) TaxID=653667 RepID=S9VTA1_SCHCR|nr:AGC protein kinase Ppk31 [Schizosaccharomyces cryophilus OY26]EPY49339.1 AGC protein kinase Ppk31 [Schizosaccharomyces cryophilus OY26]